MTDEKALQFFNDALGVVSAYGETPSRIYVSYRIWEAVDTAGRLDPKSSWRPNEMKYNGASVAVREDYVAERVDVVTKEEEHLLRMMNDLRNRALRDTGVAPVAYELGSEAYARYQRACRSISVAYQGIPVKEIHDAADHVAVQFYSAPPEWCVVSACLALKADDALWGRVRRIDGKNFQVLIEEGELNQEHLVSFADIRANWQRIPDRVVPPSRFLRILGSGSVSNLDE